MDRHSAWSSLGRFWRDRHGIRSAGSGANSGPSGAASIADPGAASDVDGSGAGGSGPSSQGIAGNGALDPYTRLMLQISERSQRPRKPDGAIRDIVELEYLSGLQKQRQLQSRIEKQQATGMAALMEHHLNGTNPGMPTATTPTTAANTSTALEDDQAIHNRCNWINHNYYQDAPREEIREDIDKRKPSPSPAPSPQQSTWSGWFWPAMILLLALILITGAIWWALTHPATPAKPGGENAFTTIKLGDAP